MIIVRSPLRICLGGGGTDLPSYYTKHTGFVMSAAINQYVYVILHQTFEKDMIIKYSKMERVKTIDEIQHPVIREALKLVDVHPSYLELSSHADIPAGTGLGSSGSFTTALLKVLHTYKRDLLSNKELADEACHIELERLREPIGKQDQYIAAFGGLTCFHFYPDHAIDVRPLQIPKEILYNIEENLLLFFTGYSRSASAVLKEQDDKSKQGDPQMIEGLHMIKELGISSMKALLNNDFKTFGDLMNEHWQYKKKRSPMMTNPQIDEWVEVGLKNGALGGKLIGAGGGGFLMFYCEDKAKLRNAMRKIGLHELRFHFDFEGTKVVAT